MGGGGTETSGGAGGAGGMGLYDPNYNYGGGSGTDTWGVVGKGLQQFGSGVAGSGQTPNFNVPQGGDYSTTVPEVSSGYQGIQTAGGEETAALFQAIKRILGGY